MSKTNEREHLIAELEAAYQAALAAHEAAVEEEARPRLKKEATRQALNKARIARDNAQAALARRNLLASRSDLRDHIGEVERARDAAKAELEVRATDPGHERRFDRWAILRREAEKLARLPAGELAALDLADERRRLALGGAAQVDTESATPFVSSGRVFS